MTIWNTNLLDSFVLLARGGGEFSPLLLALLTFALSIFFFMAAIFNWQWIYFDYRYRWFRDTFGEGVARLKLGCFGVVCLIITFVTVFISLGEPTVLLAEPGYAVGGLKSRHSTMLRGLQLVFMKVEAGHLVRSDFKLSPWVGRSNTGTEGSTDGSSGLIVGIRGTSINRRIVNQLELGSVSASMAGAGTSPTEATATPAEDDTPRAEVGGLSKPVGTDQGTAYRDIAPQGAVMAGVQVSYSFWAGRDRFLGSIQPVYRTADGKFVKGEIHGKEYPDKDNAVAKSGYAVGAIAIRPGLKLNAIRVTFMKLKGTRLDPSDSYKSEWFGTESGTVANLDGEGKPLVGIQGGCDDDANGIQAVFSKSVTYNYGAKVRDRPEKNVNSPT